MPDRNLLFLALAVAVILTSCHKSHTNLSQTQNQVAYFDDSCYLEMPTSSIHLGFWWGKPGDAVLQVNKLTGLMTDSNGVVTTISRLSAQAFFSDGIHVYPNTSAGNLVLNGSPIDCTNGNHYLSYNNAVAWNDTGTNQWQIGGSNTFPAANVSMDGSFPEFTGVLPDSVSPMNCTIAFNSTNTYNADSAVAFLFAGARYDSTANPWYALDAFTHGQNVDATNGVAGVGAVPGLFYGNYHFYIRQKSYYTALLVIILMKETQQTVNGKVFTLARQRVLYKNVIIKI